VTLLIAVSHVQFYTVWKEVWVNLYQSFHMFEKSTVSDLVWDCDQRARVNSLIKRPLRRLLFTLYETVFLNPSPQTQMRPRKALDECTSTRGNKFAVMPSHNNNFINYIQSTFLLVQRLKCTWPAWINEKFAVPHGIYTFEVVWSAA